jgi:excisionase family DNA binding protein
MLRSLRLHQSNLDMQVRETNPDLPNCPEASVPKPNDELAEELAQLQGALKPAEVAEYLEVHPATVYRMIASGQLRTIQIGSGTKRRTGLKVPQSAVIELLRGAQVAPIAPSTQEVA